MRPRRFTNQKAQSSWWLVSMDFSIFRDPELAKKLIDRIYERTGSASYTFMEVCGTHTVSIARYGFRSILPAGIKLLSGPGCPVCVTADEDIDFAIALADQPNCIVTSFGDMLRVPGSVSSLNEKKAQGADIRVCYSPLDALRIAQENPDKNVVFIGVGFETTAPIIGAALLQAQELKLKNFSIFDAHKTMPHALEALVNDPDLKLDGLILPGHVSTIIGTQAYNFLADHYKIPGVITGFEPVDVLRGILNLIEMAHSGKPSIINAYPRGVHDEGNPVAQEVIDKVFEPADSVWRGLGTIEKSGLALKPQFDNFNARKRFDTKFPDEFNPQTGKRLRRGADQRGCKCGDVLRGSISPNECPLFEKACRPEHPIGPCMVSSEGSCAAYYRYKIRAN